MPVVIEHHGLQAGRSPSGSPRKALSGSPSRTAAGSSHPGADRVYLSPPPVREPGTRTGRHRRGTDTPLLGADGRSSISAEDLAVAVLDELERPGPDRHVTVVQDSAPKGAPDRVRHAATAASGRPAGTARRTPEGLPRLNPRGD